MRTVSAPAAAGIVHVRAGLEHDVPDGDVGLGAAGPRVRRRGRRRGAGQRAGDHGDLARPSVVDDDRGMSPSQSIVKCGVDELVLGRAGSARSGTARAGSGCSASSSGNISECTMPAAGGEPLHVAPPEPGGRAERVGVVDEALAHVGDGLEAAVRVVREAGHVAPVVHPPAVDRPRSPCRGRGPRATPPGPAASLPGG